MEQHRSLSRVVAYDALRVFAIVTVVAIHTLMPYREFLPANAPVRIFDDLLHYAVPLFVFISGALIWTRAWVPEPGAYRAFVTKRAALIGLPYLAWSAVFLALRYVTDPPPPAEIPGLLLSGHVWYHLYFVPMLLTFYLLTPLAARILMRWPELLLVAAYALRILPDPAIPALANDLLGQHAFAWTTHVITHLPHMALGAWFAVRFPLWPHWVRRMWPLLLVVGTAILTAASLDVFTGWPLYARRLVYPSGMAATVIGLALLAFALEPVLERFRGPATRASALAFGVFFVHPVFLLVVFGLVAAGPGERAWLNPVIPLSTFAAVTALSFLTAWMLSRRSATAWLVGVRRRGRDT